MSDQNREGISRRDLSVLIGALYLLGAIPLSLLTNWRGLVGYSAGFWGTFVAIFLVDRSKNARN